jgi:hypothetical protein
MTGDVAGTRSVLYALMRDYLDDARRNLATAKTHASAGKWKAAAMSCSIGSRLLLDLRTELADDSILLARQRNMLTNNADKVRQDLWRVAQKVRRCGSPCPEVSKMLRSFVIYDETTQQVAEA